METPIQQRAPSPRKAKLFRCAHVSCPGLGIASNKECFMCGAYLHSFCVAETFREIEATDATVMDDKPLCYLTCYHFCLINGLTPNTVTGKQGAIAKKNKEQLKKEARECSVKVNCQVNGVSCNASKEVIVACLLEKRILQHHPSLTTSLRPKFPSDQCNIFRGTV
jgi:hypothetical protein